MKQSPVSLSEVCTSIIIVFGSLTLLSLFSPAATSFMHACIETPFFTDFMPNAIALACVITLYMMLRNELRDRGYVRG